MVSHSDEDWSIISSSSDIDDEHSTTSSIADPLDLAQESTVRIDKSDLTAKDPLAASTSEALEGGLAIVSSDDDPVTPGASEGEHTSPQEDSVATLRLPVIENTPRREVPLKSQSPTPANFKSTLVKCKEDKAQPTPAKQVEAANKENEEIVFHIALFGIAGALVTIGVGIYLTVLFYSNPPKPLKVSVFQELIDNWSDCFYEDQEVLYLLFSRKKKVRSFTKCGKLLANSAGNYSSAGLRALSGYGTVGLNSWNNYKTVGLKTWKEYLATRLRLWNEFSTIGLHQWDIFCNRSLQCWNRYNTLAFNDLLRFSKIGLDNLTKYKTVGLNNIQKFRTYTSTQTQTFVTKNAVPLLTRAQLTVSQLQELLSVWGHRLSNNYHIFKLQHILPKDQYTTVLKEITQFKGYVRLGADNFLETLGVNGLLKYGFGGARNTVEKGVNVVST